MLIADNFRGIEEFLLSNLKEEEAVYNIKELNENAVESSCKDVSPNKLKTILNFWSIKGWIKRGNLDYSRNQMSIVFSQNKNDFKQKMSKRHFLSRLIIDYLFKKVNLNSSKADLDDVLVEFSIKELKESAENAAGIFNQRFSNEDVEDALFYLSRIEAIKIEGGFLVVYNRITIDRIEKNNRILYKESDFEKLRQFYQNKVQQIHIVGEYAKKMVENYNDALQFVDDYFTLNYSSFLNRYFPGSRQDDIKRTLTPGKFRQLFGTLSPSQLEIIKDSGSQYIVVAAGPGSGKTKVLVHKLASLLLTEDVKHEQLLMLTFSRAAATEFKKRLLDLIGNAASYIEIKTFHSFCFDLIGKIGNLNDSDWVLKSAIEKINTGDIEPSRINKAVLVIDEAQDMSDHEYNLVETLMEQNEEMRVILVGDDDQNIYEFRGSDSKFMQILIRQKGAKKYELIENYRSRQNIVSIANQWASQMVNRLKSLPIVAVDKKDGEITIVEYDSNNLVIPVVQAIIDASLMGSTCVLTRTNEQALQINGLLTKNGFASKLIQSNDGFNLFNLQELRFFTDLINQQTDSAIISEDEWENGKCELIKRFNRSNKLEWCHTILNDFAAINPVKKYKSDWSTFLKESKLEDFIRVVADTIYVSTIHKAKGKEFDNVFLLLDKLDPEKEDCKRQLYVSITRAKNNLSIHYTGNYLDGLVCNELTYTKERTTFYPTKELAYLLTHQDVYLGYFDYVQHRLNNAVSGDTLNITEEGLACPDGLIVKFSNKFSQLILQLREKGYLLSNARVNYVLHWMNSTNNRDIKIILPEVYLKRE